MKNDAARLMQARDWAAKEDLESARSNPAETRAQIEADLKAYLANGGKVTKLAYAPDVKPKWTKERAREWNRDYKRRQREQPGERERHNAYQREWNARNRERVRKRNLESYHRNKHKHQKTDETRAAHAEYMRAYRARKKAERLAALRVASADDDERH